ncbi:IS3 family transposase [Mesorhizobium kowhaii]|uniref:IS3 family transposase n=1 Tax=Mesorhizobium kowhaii TaxID=1300272 RepID=UPI003CCADE13
MPRSTFYYRQKAASRPDRHAALKEAIKAIFDSHKGRYGYRRVTAQLRRLGRRVTSQDRGCADGTRKEPFLRRPG